MGDPGFSGVAAFDAADAEEFFAAALEVGFDEFYVSGRHDEDHADAHVEGLQQLVGFDFSESGEKFEDVRDRPRREIDLRLDASGKDTGQIAGNASARDVRKGGNPAARDDVSERRGVAQVRL